MAEQDLDKTRSMGTIDLALLVALSQIVNILYYLWLRMDTHITSCLCWRIPWVIVEQKAWLHYSYIWRYRTLLTCSVADIVVQKTGGGNKWPGICIEPMLIHLVAGLLTCLWLRWLGGTKINTFLWWTFTTALLGCGMCLCRKCGVHNLPPTIYAGTAATALLNCIHSTRII